MNRTYKDLLEGILAILSICRHKEEFNWLDELFPRIKAVFYLVIEDIERLINYQTNKDYSEQ